MATVNSKVTKRENFNAIIEVLKANGRDDLANVIAHEIELLDNRKNRKPSEADIQRKAHNEHLAEVMATVLTDEPARLAEIVGRNEELEDLSTSKATYVMGVLIDKGIAERVMEKRVSKYKLV